MDAMLNGMPLRDMSVDAPANELAFAYSKSVRPLLDPNNVGKCVLFVDEYNRQTDSQKRRAFYSLFNEKCNADGNLNFSKNLLFSVIAINPAGREYRDLGAAELNGAELGRFSTKMIGDEGFDYDERESLSYVQGALTEFLLNFGIIRKGSKASANHKGFYGPTKPLSKEDLEDIDIELKC